MIPNTIEKTPEGGLPVANCSLFLGDCLEMMKHIPDGSVDMVMCDLPYGTTACKWDSVIPFEPLWEQYRRACRKNAAIVLTASQPFTSALVMSNANWFKYCWVWEKKATGVFLAKHRPMQGHEDVVVFAEGKTTYNPQMEERSPQEISRMGNIKKTFSNGKNNSEHYRNCKLSDNYDVTKKYPKTVIRFPSVNSNSGQRLHPTQKPVALMEYLIRTYTNEGQTVLDNTMGSGTTGVACVNAGRGFIGIERDEEYFRVASERIYSANAATHAPGANDKPLK